MCISIAQSESVNFSFSPLSAPSIVYIIVATSVEYQSLIMLDVWLLYI